MQRWNLNLNELCLYDIHMRLCRDEVVFGSCSLQKPVPTTDDSLYLTPTGTGT